MKFEPSMKVARFTVQRVRELPSNNAVLIEMKHDYSGAQLAWMKREDVNKTFAISFTTIPQDNTGVFHILEHSVLNGSDKYPVKEPFVELLKGSMQTFLNAMTYPDKTVFPFSTRNDQDYLNLMSVYLDAVFHPAIYRNPDIFRQEGWHYEINDPQDDPVYNGVVYNEMKGALDSVDETILNGLNQLVYPDTSYRFIAGGDPADIPDLSYERFIETHRRFYTASNAKIWLDGSVDIETVLPLLDQELSRHPYVNPPHLLRKQPLRKARENTVYYALSPDQDMQGQSYFEMGRIIGDYTEMEKIYAATMLGYMLTDSNDAPLTRVILDQDLGRDVSIWVSDEVLQPMIILDVRNTDPEKFSAIKTTVREFMRHSAEEGLDHNRLQSTVDLMEYYYQEPGEPAGIMNVRDALRSWNYGTDPALYLEYPSLFSSLRKKIDEGYFEQLLAELFLSDDRMNVLEVLPSHEYAENRQKQEQERLHKVKQSWSDSTVYVRKNQELKKAQSTPDSPEALASIPLLCLSDISRDPLYYPCRKETIGQTPVHLFPDQDVRYLQAYFSLKGLKKQELAWADMLTGLYGSLPTKRHSAQQLNSLIKSLTPRLSFAITAGDVYEDPGQSYLCLQVSVGMLKRNEKEAMDLVWEILTETVWDEKRVLDMVKQANDGYQLSIISSGHSYAMTRAKAALSCAGTIEEEISGWTRVQRMHAFQQHYFEQFPEFARFADSFASKYLTRGRVMLSVSGNGIPEVARDFLARLAPSEPVDPYVSYPPAPADNEGIVIPSGVSFAAYAALLPDMKTNHRPGYSVSSTILSLDYLWNRTRTLGGAYGTGTGIRANGVVLSYSYRDPDPRGSIEAFRQQGKYLEQFDEKLDRYIIGTIGNSEPVLSFPYQMRYVDAMALAKVTFEQLKKRRIATLTTSLDDIHEAGKALDTVLDKGHYCVVGPSSILDEFKEIKRI